MKKLLVLPLLFVLSLASVAQSRLSKGAESPLRKLQMAEMAITNLYVDTVDEDKLVEDAIRGMLEKLDPHSSYTSAKETKAMHETLNGSFEGIGVQFNMADDTLIIVQPVSNGPSEKVGIVAGDRIITVNDTLIAGVKMSREDIMRRLRGPKGSKVKLGIMRRGIAGLQTLVVVRDKIPVETVEAVYMIRPQVGYIRIGSFGSTTYEEVMIGIKTLQAAGMKDLILDLQDNGGGYLGAAVHICDEFLQRNDLIVYTEGRRGRQTEFRAQGNGRFLQGKVVVLINEYSASASEIVAGAIQDQDRGMVVGRRSFGKGLVQSPVELADGSMIRLTTAHYFTPSGRNIQKPYTKGDTEGYAKELEVRMKHGELYHVDSIHFSDSLKYHTLRRNRVVYGGGGIMPDFFVPLDTTQFTKFHQQLAVKSIIVSNNLKYIDKHRAKLKKKYTRFDDFLQNYEVPQSLIDQILKDAEKDKVKPKDETELQNTLPALKQQLKALVARDLWDLSAYFQVMNERNNIVMKAVELIK